MSCCFIWSFITLEQSKLKDLSLSLFTHLRILLMYTTPSQQLFPLSVLRLLFFALCALSLALSLLLSLSLLLLSLCCTLWYADMQEFLGLKMIDQSCQPWLLLLKMAAPAVCVPTIGALLSYFPYHWAQPVCLRLTCCWQKCELVVCFVCVRTSLMG